MYICGSGSKPKVCNRSGAHTRDIPGYIAVCNRQVPVATTPPIGITVLSHLKPRDKPRQSTALHTFVTEGCWRGASGTGF